MTEQTKKRPWWRGQYYLPLILLVCCGMVSALLLRVEWIGGDDLNTVEQTAQMSLWQWLSFRYQGWSGRVLGGDLFVWLVMRYPIRVWKVLNLFAYAAFSVYAFRCFACVCPQKLAQKGYALRLALFSCAILFFQNLGALSQGVFWVTGTFYYLWPCLFGMVGLYPFIASLFEHRVSVLDYVLAALAMIPACNAQEQVGAFLVAFTLFLLLVAFLRTHTIRWPLAGLFGVALASLLFNVTAPGSDVRYVTEVANNLPDFETIGKLARLEYSLRWFLDHYINRNGAGLILVLGLLTVCTASRRQKSRLDMFCLFVYGCALMMRLNQTAMCWWANFYPEWGGQYPKDTWFPILFWLLVLACIAAGFLRLPGFDAGQRFTLAVAYLGSVCCTAMLCLSPTMYASAERVMFVPTLLLCFLVFFVFLMLDARPAAQQPVFFSAATSLAFPVIFIFPLWQWANLAGIYYFDRFRVLWAAA